MVVKLTRPQVNLFRRSQIAGVPDRRGSRTAEPPVSLLRGGGEQFLKFWPDGDIPKLIRSIVNLFLGSETNSPLREFVLWLFN